MKKSCNPEAGRAAKKPPVESPEDDARAVDPKKEDAEQPREIGGPKGPEPTRYGDWERNGRCSDF